MTTAVNPHQVFAGRWSRLAVILALFALLAAIVVWSLPRPEIRQRQATLIDASTCAVLAADKPDIGLLDRYVVNRLNPFVPFNDPGRNPAPGRGKSAWSTTLPEPIPTRPAPEVLYPTIDPLAWPTLTGDSQALTCVGLVQVEEQPPVLLVRLSGQSQTQPLHPGESVAGWTLLAIDADNLARFRDAAGSEHQLAIGLAPAGAIPARRAVKPAVKSLLPMTPGAGRGVRP